MKHPFHWEEAMTQVTLLLEPSVALFYSHIAETAGFSAARTGIINKTAKMSETHFFIKKHPF